MSDLDDLKAKLEKAVDKQPGICVQCRQPFTDKNVHTEAGWKETKISGMCEDCFDEMWGDE